ncbi:unnamed protein product (mitochondrion) [Plasmodiophora brassicae]|uniref:non-specific serine/threonine protein kinase n=1 Tax=Plasmodiophora brassicae TaxID=37360 RepID=A0A0G4IKL8_PLABS|nr:hypothetical protein PBRA_004358 [Plasmodiophora brassicae]SPR00500.1 unnamed protein product [Plasmodiophora brassicae]
MGKYKVLKKLGQGSYGTVFLVQDEKDGRLFVMKKINVAGMSQNELVDCKREIQILSMLKHPNIIGYQRSFVRRGALCIVMDYADNSDLHRLIHRQKKVRKTGGFGYLPEDQVIDLLTQVALGLRHIHQHKILHRDLKTQNIFLTKTGGVRLGDFGISRVMANTMDQAKTLVGTPYYLSPEMVNGLPYDSKTDMWSLGVVLYEMLTLEHPFNADNLQMLALRIIQGNYPPIPSHYSKDVGDLLSGLLEQDPLARLSIDQCLAHPIIAPRAAKFMSAGPSPSLGSSTMTTLASSMAGDSDEQQRSRSMMTEEDVDEIAPSRKKVLVRHVAQKADATPQYEPSSYQHHHRSSSVVVEDTSMGHDAEPDWNVQHPTHQKDHRLQSAAAFPNPEPFRSNQPVTSREVQCQVLRQHLESKLGAHILANVVDILRSACDDATKSANISKLVGPHHEVMPIVHTLIYLER